MTQLMVSGKKSRNSKSPVDRRFEKPKFIGKARDKSPKIKTNWREKNDNKEREKTFEKRRKNTRFLCHSDKHYKRDCPEFKKKEMIGDTIHHIKN